MTEDACPMESKLVSESKWVTTEWWTCLESHRHTSKKIAEACIRTSLSRKAPKWTHEGRHAVLLMRRSGMKYREIGLLYGLSACRIMKVCRQAEGREDWVKKRRLNTI